MVAVTFVDISMAGASFISTPGVGEGHASLVCCDSWGHKELDTTDTTEPN